MSDDATETPWAMVQRLHSAGASPEAVVIALQARGLDASELELLLKHAPGFSPQPQAPLVRRPDPPHEDAARDRWLRRWILYFLLLVLWDGATAFGPLPSALFAIPALVALTREWRARGWRRTLRRLAYSLFFLTTLPTVLLFAAHHHEPTWLVLNGLLWALSIPALVGASRGAAGLKGVSDFAEGPTFEHRDVHFTVKKPSRVTVPFGGAFELELFAQSCVDAPRVLVVQVLGDVGIVVGPTEHRFELQPGYVTRVTLPVRVRSLQHEVTHELIIAVGGEGSGGTRLSLEEGESYLSPGNEVVHELLGAFQFNEQAVVKVRVDTALPPVDEARAPSVKVVFEPRRADVDAAALR